MEMSDDASLDLCAECARRGETCCQKVEIFVTLGDIERIAAYTGETDFHEWRDQEDPTYYRAEDDPVWVECTIRADGRRRFVKQKANGDCLMLTEQGCKLPLQVRPLICRLYPWDYGDEGLRGIIAEYCPTDVLPEGATPVEVIGIPEAQARQWRELLYEEIRWEAPGSRASSARRTT